MSETHRKQNNCNVSQLAPPNFQHLTSWYAETLIFQHNIDFSIFINFQNCKPLSQNVYNHKHLIQASSKFYLCHRSKVSTLCNSIPFYFAKIDLLLEINLWSPRKRTRPVIQRPQNSVSHKRSAWDLLRTPVKSESLFLRKSMYYHLLPLFPRKMSNAIKSYRNGIKIGQVVGGVCEQNGTRNADGDDGRTVTEARDRSAFYERRQCRADAPCFSRKVYVLGHVQVHTWASTCNERAFAWCIIFSEPTTFRDTGNNPSTNFRLLVLRRSHFLRLGPLKISSALQVEELSAHHGDCYT